MTHQKEGDFLTTPTATLLAGILVSISIFLGASKIAGNGASAGIGQVAKAAVPSVNPVAAANITVVPFSPEKDHFLGNARPQVTIIEYSDTECPFCKQFDPVLHKIVANYSDKVAWVYRHMPLSIHPRAAKEAEATECATAQGGNYMFWKYMNRLLAVTPSNNGLDPAQLPEIAKYVGLDVAKFQSCLDSGVYTAKVKAMTSEGELAGGRGTPYTIIVGPKGNNPITGSVSYETIEAAIKAALAQ